jgi:LmbE family N-acetylglucosaminyl deacetylase
VQKVALRPEWMRAKREALAEHRSQLGDGAILPDFLLAPARREFEVFAWAH